MATKNGLCPYCKNTNRIQNRIFKVNPEASVTFCPTCLKQINPKEAIGLYDNLIDSMLEKADNSLFVACDPTLAYQQYADVLELERSNSRALLGRIICLIYTSKTRQSYISEAESLLELVEHKGQEEVATYVSYIKRINFALDEYDLSLFKRLTHRKVFYDEECVRMYLKHLNEIIDFKENILKKLKDIKRDYASQNNEILINLINHNINEKETFLKSIKRVANGAEYKYLRTYNGNVQVEKIKEQTLFRVPKIMRFTLKEDVRGKATIKDTVFKDYTPVIKAKTVSTVLAIIFFVIACGAGLCVYLFRSTLLYFALSIGGASLFLILSILMVIFHFVFKATLKKRKMRID